MADWNTPLLNSLKGTDAVVLQQIIRNLIIEVQRLNTEIETIKGSTAVNSYSGMLKSR
jgi:hypothetical protein